MSDVVARCGIWHRWRCRSVRAWKPTCRGCVLHDCLVCALEGEGMSIEDLIANNIAVTHDGETRALPSTRVKYLDRRVTETIRDLSDDGFNPFGSGPEPITPKE